MKSMNKNIVKIEKYFYKLKIFKKIFLYYSEYKRNVILIFN